MHDRGRVHADGLTRRVRAEAWRRAHGREDDHVDRRHLVGGLAAVLSALATLVVALAGAAWQSHAPLPVPRTEVAAAPFRGRHRRRRRLPRRRDVHGRRRSLRSRSRRAGAGSPTCRSASITPRPRRQAESSTSSVATAGRESGCARRTSSTAIAGARWRRCPTRAAPPVPAIVGGKLYVVGGVGPERARAPRVRARPEDRPLDDDRRSPTPREHLAVDRGGGKVYARRRPSRRLRHEPPRLRVVLPGNEALVEAGAAAGPTRWHGSRLRERAHRLRGRGGAAGHDRLRLRLQRRDEALAPPRRSADAAPRGRRRGGRRPRLRHRRRHRTRACTVSGANESLALP